MPSNILPAGLFSNVNVANLKSLIKPLSTRSIITPASFIFRDRRSGCQAIKPSILPFSISSISLLNSSRVSAILAEKLSLYIFLILKPFGVITLSTHSFIWSSIDEACLSSLVVDLRAYNPYCTGLSELSLFSGPLPVSLFSNSFTLVELLLFCIIPIISPCLLLELI